jgi:hypothetical protein
MADESDLPPIQPGDIQPHKYNPTVKLLEWLTKTVLGLDNLPEEAREQYNQIVWDGYFHDAVSELEPEMLKDLQMRLPPTKFEDMTAAELEEFMRGLPELDPPNEGGSTE